MLPHQIRTQLAADRQAEITRATALPRHDSPQAQRARRPALTARLLGRAADVTA